MSQYQQDDLARLFAQNMSFSQPLPQNPSTPDKQFVNHTTTSEPIYYASQHYTPPSYTYQQPTSPAMRADSPLSAPEENLESTLRQHDIDPSSLSPSQVKLFINADYEQRLRLLELWRISPPDHSSNSWSTSMAQEEELARLRYEERMRQRDLHGVNNQQNHLSESPPAEAEPYITSGYAHHRHSDPVYSSSGLWQSASHTRAVQEMEDSYGAFEQARNFDQLQALNYQVERQRLAATHASADDDMVM